MRDFGLSLRGRVKNFSLPENKSLIPLFEAVVNSLQAIAERQKTCDFLGEISILIDREDSAPEKRFATVCEQSAEVLKWLRPAPKQFSLYYGNSQRYEPDFVVETETTMYLVEIKGEDKLNEENNLLKKQRAVKYCSVASVYCNAHNLKEWRYLYIPSQQVQTNSSFAMLAQRFEVNDTKAE